MPDHPGEQLTERYRSILSPYGNVLNTSRSDFVPGQGASSRRFRPFSDSTHLDDLGLFVSYLEVDQGFISTYGLELVEGRDFSKSDKYGTFMLNEAAMRHFGWTSCTNQKVEVGYRQGSRMKVSVRGDVVGVVKDFHYKSLHHEIEPLIIMTNSSDTFCNFGLIGETLLL